MTKPCRLDFSSVLYGKRWNPRKLTRLILVIEHLPITVNPETMGGHRVFRGTACKYLFTFGNKDVCHIFGGIITLM